MNRATTTEALTALLAAHAAEIAALKAENETLAQRVTHLEEQLRLERLHRYAPRSEKRKERIFNEAEQAAAEAEEADDVETAAIADTGMADVAKPAPQKRGRQPLPDSLPRERVEHDLPEDQKTCPRGRCNRRISRSLWKSSVPISATMSWWKASWQSAKLVANEAQRLAALHELGVLDTPPEERFDRLTRLAAALFEVPVALITLVDRDRQWFKSRHGIDLVETPRDMSFCAHALFSDKIMIIPDARLDHRFADNPLVTREPRFRFYAGYPIQGADGICFGTLCLLDMRPRDLDKTKLALLRDLGSLVRRELCGC